MERTNFTFDKPEGWHIIKPECYRDFSILSTELVPCVYAFAVDRPGGGYNVISVFDYGEWEESFINAYKNQVEVMRENPENTDSVNNFIEENAEDFNVKTTSFMQPLFCKDGKFSGMNCLLSIMKIVTNMGEAYSLQAFVNFDGKCLCFGTSASQIDEEDPFNSIISMNDFIHDMFYKLIKSIKIVD